MLKNVLIQLFQRDLRKLYGELEKYTAEASIWKTEKGIANSAGNLCLHLVGNLNTFIGKEMGNTGYVRNRDQEFTQKDVPRAQLLKMIEDTIAVVIQTLEASDESRWADQYPVQVFDKPTSTEYMLVHLASHLAYHLGQVNYHRRLIDG